MGRGKVATKNQVAWSITVLIFLFTAKKQKHTQENHKKPRVAKDLIALTKGSMLEMLKRIKVRIKQNPY